MIRKSLLAAAVALAALAAVQAPALAGGKRIKFHHLHLAPLVLVDDCNYYWYKWQHTGSFFWKKQYFICKGWW